MRILLSPGLVFAFSLPPLEALAQLAQPGKTKVKRRSNGDADLRRSDFEEHIDESREHRKENREDWQDHWNSYEQQEEREHLQRERAGAHKACI